MKKRLVLLTSRAAFDSFVQKPKIKEEGWTKVVKRSQKSCSTEATADSSDLMEFTPSEDSRSKKKSQKNIGSPVHLPSEKQNHMHHHRH